MSADNFRPRLSTPHEIQHRHQPQKRKTNRPDIHVHPNVTLCANRSSLKRSAPNLNAIRDPTTGFTCLHHAALNGHLECLQLLLANGAHPNAVDYKGSAPIHLAAWAGQLNIVLALLAHRPPPPLPMEVNAIADFESQLTFVDVNLINNDGQTALSLAAQFGHTRVVGELLAGGASVHLRNERLESPLELAALNGHLETVDLLLRVTPELAAELRRPRALVLVTPGTPTRPNPLLGSPGRRRSMGAGNTTASNSGGITSGWANLLRGRQSEANLGTNLTIRNRNAQPSTIYKQPSANWADFHMEPQVCPVERLAAQSALHYAARGRHVDIVALLFHRYQANPLHLTALGTILHEIAIGGALALTPQSESQTAHTGDITEELLRLLFGRLISLSQLEQLIAARDLRHRTIFDLLRELDNRFAASIHLQVLKLAEETRQRLLHQQNLQRHQYQMPVRAPQPLQQPMTHHLTDAASAAAMRSIDPFVTLKRPPAHLRAQTTNRRAQQGNVVDQSMAMTRSSSNLAVASDNELAWQRWIAGPAYQSPAGVQWPPPQNNMGGNLRQRRSKSRDLGTLLLEAQERAAAAAVTAQSQMVRSRTDFQLHQIMPGQPQCLPREPIYWRPTETITPANYGGPPNAATSNRHYHVYERRQVYAAPAVPAEVELMRARTMRSSTRSSSSACSAPTIQHETDDSASRLSLNGIYPDQRTPLRQMQPANAGALQVQLAQKTPRPKDPPPPPPAGSDTSRVINEQQPFEAAQQALLHEFDRLVAEELLAGCSVEPRPLVQSIATQVKPQPTQQLPTTSFGPCSQLTGVSLDMDLSGERLTVSATRLSMPPTGEAQSHAVATQTDPPPPRPPAATNQPQAPPRPSLRNKNVNSNQADRANIASDGSGPVSTGQSQQSPKPATRLATPLSVQATASSVGEEPVGLLKLASTTSSHSSSGLARDSGLCTSNSPASTDESSSRQVELGLPKAMPNATSRSPDKPCFVQIDHVPGASKSEDVVRPPSPHTAQLCIEQFLTPLQKTANWNSQNELTTTGLKAASDFHYSVELVGRWLGASKAHSVASDYENCQEIQTKLVRQARQVIDSTNDTYSHVSGDDDDDDSDYAAPSSDSSSSSHDLTSRRKFRHKTASKRLICTPLLKSKNETCQHDTAADQQHLCNSQNRQELEQLAESQTRSSTDAATLTDKELSPDGHAYQAKAADKLPTVTTDEGQTQTLKSQRDPIEETADTTAAMAPTKCQSVKLPDDRQGVDDNIEQLCRWFHEHMAQLEHHLPKFLSNGFDSLRFLNHPQLINDHTLRQIGLDDRSHRLFIIERISQELAGVQLTPERLEEATIRDLLEMLSLKQLIAKNHIISDMLLKSQAAVIQLRRFATETELPLGHRARLLSAAEQLQDRRQQKQLEVKTQNDSSSMERSHSQDFTREEPGSNMSPTSSSSSSANSASMSSVRAARPAPKSETCVIVSASPAYNSQPMMTKSTQPPKTAETPPPNVAGRSLVCEAARKLEAAAVAAATASASRSTGATKRPPVPSARHNVSIVQKVGQQNDSNLNVATKRAPVCWPPQRPQPIEFSPRRPSPIPTAAIHATLGPEAARPSKPPPPAKPAKLASSRFVPGMELSQRL